MVHGLMVALVLAAAPAQSAGDAGVESDPLMKLGRTLSADFWAGRLDAVWARMGPEMRAALGGSVSGLATARDKIITLVGEPRELLGEQVLEISGIPVYLRTFRATRVAERLQEQWAIQGNRTVVGFYVRPAKTDP